jgi:hypothetical protein
MGLVAQRFDPSFRAGIAGNWREAKMVGLALSRSGQRY